jgi:hypothetical protein
MIIYLSLIVSLVGLFIYFASTTNAKLTEVGHVMFWTGLLAFLISFGSGHVVALR